MKRSSLMRLDLDTGSIRSRLLQHCRLQQGEIWEDPLGYHKIGCGDAVDFNFIQNLFQDKKATLAVHDPPYNLVMFEQKSVEEFAEWCRTWVENSYQILSDNSSFYIWLGADQNNHFQPLPQFITMMIKTNFDSRSFITMRNQRGYGTQKNWMAVRQELLYYTKGKPEFEVHYTDIPKILRGYYKVVNGEMTENLQRSKSPNIRPGNVWVDIQQVFYRMEENVNGCYAQKPLKSIERIVKSSSNKNDIVTDFFSHSGTTLIACEKLGRSCYTVDIDPIFAELSIRRLERLRQTGKSGWQGLNPFEKELSNLHQKVSA